VHDAKEMSLEHMSENILSLLKRYSPVVIPGMDPSLHYLAPHIPKTTWTALGDLVATRERSTTGSVPGECWISLRLDGSNFSKTVRVLRRNGILEPEGFSEVFASCMQKALRALMEHFNGRVGYTQSDEMVVFIPPASVVRGEQQVHCRSGRVTKLTTLAASFVTAHFIMQLGRHCESKGVGLEDLAHILPHFDCRLGSYTSWEEARGLLLWRVYDCSVNGVSDAVYHMKDSGKEIQGLGKREKIEWLWAQNRLPLPRHQAYGTVLVRVKRVIEGHNPKLNSTVQTLRSVIEQVDGPVLELMRTETMVPEDDAPLDTPLHCV
jgi:tRNA(His) 5'-end guanylyltransferase